MVTGRRARTGSSGAAAGTTTARTAGRRTATGTADQPEPEPRLPACPSSIWERTCLPGRNRPLSCSAAHGDGGQNPSKPPGAGSKRERSGRLHVTCPAWGGPEAAPAVEDVFVEHDQRFKTLIREFLVEFVTLFFPMVAALLDLRRLSWLDKELFTDPPRGDVYLLDLVARVPTLADPAVSNLLHIEVESRKAVAKFRPRVYDYNHFLGHKHQCPVVTLAAYLRVGLRGSGIDSYVENDITGLEKLRFQFRYVGFPSLDAATYVAGDNWLGVALSALMRIAPAPGLVAGGGVAADTAGVSGEQLSPLSAGGVCRSVPGVDGGPAAAIPTLAADQTLQGDWTHDANHI